MCHRSIHLQTYDIIFLKTGRTVISKSACVSIISVKSKCICTLESIWVLYAISCAYMEIDDNMYKSYCRHFHIKGRCYVILDNYMFFALPKLRESLYWTQRFQFWILLKTMSSFLYKSMLMKLVKLSMYQTFFRNIAWYCTRGMASKKNIHWPWISHCDDGKGTGRKNRNPVYGKEE